MARVAKTNLGFVLKAGVVCCFDSPSRRLPIRVARIHPGIYAIILNMLVGYGYTLEAVCRLWVPRQLQLIQAIPATIDSILQFQELHHALCYFWRGGNSADHVGWQPSGCDCFGSTLWFSMTTSACPPGTVRELLSGLTGQSAVLVDSLYRVA